MAAACVPSQYQRSCSCPRVKCLLTGLAIAQWDNSVRIEPKVGHVCNRSCLYIALTHAITATHPGVSRRLGITEPSSCLNQSMTSNTTYSRLALTCSFIWATQKRPFQACTCLFFLTPYIAKHTHCAASFNLCCEWQLQHCKPGAVHNVRRSSLDSK